MDEEEKPKTKDYVLGQPLDRLSVDELGDLVAALNEEIARIEAEIARKVSDRSAAESLFRS